MSDKLEVVNWWMDPTGEQSRQNLGKRFRIKTGHYNHFDAVWCQVGETMYRFLSIGPDGAVQGNRVIDDNSRVRSVTPITAPHVARRKPIMRHKDEHLHNTEICPVCGNPDVSFDTTGPVEPDGIHQRGHCDCCGFVFDDLYALSGVVAV